MSSDAEAGGGSVAEAVAEPVGIPPDTPLSAFLRVLFGLEHLKFRGVPLQVAMLPDFIIDMEQPREGVWRLRLSKDEQRRARRAGGHATLATLALQMLHRRELPLFGLTYVAKTDKVGRAFMQQFLVDQVSGTGFPVDLDSCLDSGTHRVSFVRDIPAGGEVAKARLCVQAIDPESELKWAELLTHERRPLDRLADANAVGLFSPKAKIYEEMLAEFFTTFRPEHLRRARDGESWAGGGEPADDLPPQVVLLDLRNVHVPDPSPEGKTPTAEEWAKDRQTWVRRTLQPAIHKMRLMKYLPVVSAGFREAMFLTSGVVEPHEGLGRPAALDAVRKLAEMCGCPVVFHNSLLTFLADPEGTLGIKDGGTGVFAPTFHLKDVFIRNGGSACFNAGFLLALGVRQKLRRVAGPPPCLVPTVRECMLMGNLLAAAFLSHGRHADRNEVYELARRCRPLTLQAAKNTAQDQAADKGLVAQDMPDGGDGLAENEGAWQAVPVLNGEAVEALESLNPAALVDQAERALAAGAGVGRSRSSHDPLLNALAALLEYAWAKGEPQDGCSSRRLPEDVVGHIWEAIDGCPDDDVGRLLFGALLQALAFDHGLFSDRPDECRRLARPGGRPGDSDPMRCVFVDLDSTLFDSRKTWWRCMSNALAVLLDKTGRQTEADRKTIEQAVQDMRDFIYDSHLLFRTWDATHVDTRQVWCQPQHFFAFLALRDVQPKPSDDKGLGKLLKDTFGKGGPARQAGANVEKIVETFFKTHDGKRFKEAYDRKEREEQTRKGVAQAIQAFYDVPYVPYLDAPELFFLLEKVGGFRVYVCSEGDEQAQSRKLKRLRLFLDEGSGRVKVDRFLTTEAAASPEEPLEQIEEAIAKRHRQHEKSAGRRDQANDAVNEVTGVVDVYHADMGHRLHELVSNLAHGAPAVAAVDKAIAGCCSQLMEPVTAVLSRLQEHARKAEAQQVHAEDDIEGLEFTRHVFEMFKTKGNNPSFFARCIQAVLENPAVPTKGLHRFTLPQNGTEGSLQLAMIGDRYDSDVKPLHDLQTECRTNGRQVTTIRLLAGHYRNQGPIKGTPDQPTFVAYSLSEVLSLLLKSSTWNETAGITKVALTNRLPEGEHQVQAFLKAHVMAATDEAPQVVKDVTDLILNELPIQNDQAQEEFRLTLHQLSSPGRHDVDDQVKQEAHTILGLLLSRRNGGGKKADAHDTTA